MVQDGQSMAKQWAMNCQLLVNRGFIDGYSMVYLGLFRDNQQLTDKVANRSIGQQWYRSIHSFNLLFLDNLGITNAPAKKLATKQIRASKIGSG